MWAAIKTNITIDGAKNEDLKLENVGDQSKAPSIGTEVMTIVSY